MLKGLSLGAVMAGLCLMSASPAAAERPPRGVGKCETQKSSGYEGRSYWLGPEFGGENFRTTATTTVCQPPTGNPLRFHRWGLYSSLEPRGPVVEDKYDAVAPYSTSAALVKREDGAWVRYQFRKGEVGKPLPYAQVLTLVGEPNCETGLKNTQRRSAAMVAALSAPAAGGKQTAHIYFGDGEPTIIEGLGGPGVTTPIERHNDILIARWVDSDGVTRLRLHSLSGRPVSPVLGKIEQWTTVTELDDKQLYRPCPLTESIDLFVVGPSLDNDDTGVWGALLTPMGIDGAPLVLPQGAIGVAPVPLTARSRVGIPAGGGTYAPYPMTRVWAVIYPAAEGFEFTLHEGSIAQALAASPTAERYVELARNAVAERNTNIFQPGPAALVARTRDGQWQGRGYFREEIRSASAPTREVATASITTAVQNTTAAEIAALEAAEVAKRERVLAAFDASFTNGDPCGYTPPWNMGKDRVARHAVRCPHRYNPNDVQRMIASGYPSQSIGAVESNRAAQYDREQAYRAEQAEMARNYVPPGAWQAAVRAASDAQVRNIQQSGQNWLDQRQQQHNADWQRSQRAY